MAVRGMHAGEAPALVNIAIAGFSLDPIRTARTPTGIAYQFRAPEDFVVHGLIPVMWRAPEG